MLNQLFLYIAMLFGWSQARADIHDAFTLFKEGKYQEATKLIRTSRMYDVMDARDEHENTLLIAAVLYGDAVNATGPYLKHILQEEAIDCILDKVEFSRMYIDRRDTNWQTAFSHAVQQSNEDVAEYLYIHGADPHMKDVYGKSARDYATLPSLRQALLSWEWEYFEIMRDAHNVWRLLRTGMYNALISLILPKLSDLELISMRDRMGNSLIIAPILYSFSISYDVSYPEKENLIIQFLDEIYENIADHEARSLLLDVQNRRGQNAMMWAAKYGHEGVVDWLRHRGADMLLIDKCGRRASDYATYKQLKDRLEDWQIEQELGWRTYEAAPCMN